MPRSDRSLPFAAENCLKFADELPAPETLFFRYAGTPHPHTCNQTGCESLRNLDRITFPARHRCAAAS
jgi:hypothetical protein